MSNPPKLIPAYNPPGGWTSYRFNYTISPGRGFSYEVKEQDLPKIESTEPIVAYRVWHLDKETSLVSCFKKEHWPFREKMVRGTGDLNMGIHAVRNYKHLLTGIPDDISSTLFGSNGLWSDYKADVAGEVYLWGEVKECQHGYLAEFAYPKKLYMPENADPVTVMQLEENYGVPVELNPDLKPWKETEMDIILRTMSWTASQLWTPQFQYPIGVPVGEVDKKDEND